MTTSHSPARPTDSDRPTRARRTRRLRWPALWVGLAQWATRRPLSEAGRPFSNHRGQRGATIFFVVLTGVEAVVTHLVLLAIFDHAWWVWVLFVFGVYNSIWILAKYYACMARRPHVVVDDEVRLRCGTIAELVVPRHAIRGARRAEHGRGALGKLNLERARGSRTYEACFTNGAGSVAIDLDPTVRLVYRGKPTTKPISRVFVTADEPDELVASLRAI